MSKKIKTVFLTIVVATLLLFLCVGATVPVYAEAADTEQTVDNEIESVETETDTDEEEPAPNLEELADRFKSYLIGKFGDDYEYYYNQIIEQWGSIEGYLLAFGEKLPEEYQSGWDKFVGWLKEYAPVWATPLAVIIVIVVAVVGKKVFNKVIDRIINSKLKPVVQELNSQSNAVISIMHAQKALLGNGNNEKFADNIAELEKAEKELTDG